MVGASRGGGTGGCRTRAQCEGREVGGPAVGMAVLVLMSVGVKRRVYAFGRAEGGTAWPAISQSPSPS